jgi:uncharacterized membrane protein
MFPEGWLASEGLGYLFVALIVGTLLALGFGRTLRRPRPGAEDILKRRYAAGRLTRQQYEERLEGLRR